MNKAKSLIYYTLLVLGTLIGSLMTTRVQAQEVKQKTEEEVLKQLESQQKIDSLLSTIDTVSPQGNIISDSILLADSIQSINQARLDSLNHATPKIAPMDEPTIDPNQWRPNPTKATWYAIIFPGGGQIYNRKYWKLPIFYGGFAGCAYALNWNNTMYKDYSQAYRDLKDNNPNTNSYLELLPPNVTIDEGRLETILKNRKDKFRRYRDLSVIAFIGVYVLSIIDAYVDAELSNFDITPDLSMRIEPTIINNNTNTSNNNILQNNSVGLQCKFTF
ncbi:hypothetical protein Bcop_0697 [Bacteroides coprosuis DSM 18011]|uniref:DUF5683 domain-containing protein n=1 Tax=Bacteroides coprosuis DSM 18011 TaxID=679937 RepID=F3ZSP0_9BACE|nr:MULTISPECIES: DUF5683 domain-containing protein [Bacteroides]EGJ70914.1 hypothetical protein Bcop_0697 [Bacteroides coprosuis DSM 18011]HJD91101.1 DUF5683 domain-containing protein [Bacteroides coprosuis]